MHTRKVTRTLTARDGTRISWHTHRPMGPGAPDDVDIAKRPTMLLTNGIGTSENFWKHLVHVFAHDHRVVHWDYRGHGDSDVARSGDYAMQTFADDLALVTEAAIRDGDGVTPPVHVGFSMGVVVTLELYRTRPDLIPAMVLVGGPAEAPWSTTGPLRMPGALPVVRGLLAGMRPLVRGAAPGIHALFNAPFAYPLARALGLLRDRAPRDEVAAFTENLARMDPRAFWDTLCALMQARATDVLRTVQVPTLVIGASHDRFIPRAQIEKLAAALPGPHRVVIEDTGHAILLEAGPEVAAAMRLFLRSIEPARR
jgi:pimeloyl-ACP methyl ester carboxylesterase